MPDLARRSIAAAARVAVLVAPAALACGLLTAAGARAPGQEPGAAWIPATERYDPVTDAYRPAVLHPLPLEAVRAVQAALAREGQDPGPLTGVLDGRTRSALRSFQVDRGLRITGLADYATVVALGLPVRRVPSWAVASPPRPPRRASTIIVVGPGVDLPPVGVPAEGMGIPPAPAPPAPPEPPLPPPPGVGPAPDPSLEAPPAQVEPPPTISDPPAPTPRAPRTPRGMTPPRTPT